MLNALVALCLYAPPAEWEQLLARGGAPALQGLRALAGARTGVDLITQALPQPELRQAALLALGRIEDPAALPALVDALPGPEGRAAVFALGQLGVGNPALAPTVERHLLGVTEGRLGLFAWQALARVGGAATIARAFDEEALRPNALVAAAQCLARLGEAPGDAWVALLDEDDAEVRAAALYAWSRAARGASLLRLEATLTRALAGGPTSERVLAARILRRHGVPDALVQAVTAAIPGVEAHEAAALVEGLGAAAAPFRERYVLDFVERVHAGRDTLVSPRLHAVRAALVAPLSPAVLAALRSLPANTAPEQRRRDALVCALAEDDATLDATCAGGGRVERAAALKRPTDGWLTDQSPARRMAAVEGTESPESVRAALDDPDRPVVATACTRAAELKLPLGAVLLQRVTSALDAQDDEVAIGCVAAAKALGADVSGLPVHNLAFAREAGLPWVAPPLPALPGPSAGPQPAELVVETEVGTLRMALEAEAPETTRHIAALACAGRYDGLVFHRVVADFVVQTGDPRGDGWGGLTPPIACENNDLPYTTGSVGMALAGKDTGSSQWFITHSAHPHLQGTYTHFGHLLAGIDALDRLFPGDHIVRARASTCLEPGMSQ